MLHALLCEIAIYAVNLYFIIKNWSKNGKVFEKPFSAVWAESWSKLFTEGLYCKQQPDLILL